MFFQRFLPAIVLAFAAATATAGETAFDQRASWQKHESWMHQSDGNVAHDLNRAAREGKSLMILWEQQGCVYCQRLRQRNFENPRIRALLEENFLVLPLDISGDRPVRGPDGRAMTEAQLARAMRVTGTPTTVVYNSGGVLDDVARTSVAFRMPGYLSSFHYFTVLGYFLSDRHGEMSLRDYTAELEADFRAQGVDPDRW